ncbi:MAG TPA: Ig-like domain-containing protein [Anaerolineales bacterium]|nr:Ig-like domain-containing protein [Anaerolineales bacterium]
MRRVFLLLAAVFLLSGFARQESVRPEFTVLRFQRAPAFQIGDPIEFLLLLETQSGSPLAGQRIEIYLDGQHAGTVETDALGSARFRPAGVLSAGPHTIEAVYQGFQFYRSTSVRMQFNVEPAEIVVQTVPVIAGLEFTLDGRAFRTGPDGLARITVDRTGDYDLQLSLEQEALAGLGAVFTGWWPEGAGSSMLVTVPGAQWVQAGFELSFPVVFEFVDLKGAPVDEAVVESVVLRGSDGIVHTLTAGDTLELRANRILVRLSGLDSVAVVHSVQSVIVAGVELVNRGQQRFIYARGLSFQVELLFYDVQFFSRDLLFGRTVAGALELVYPDGERKLFPLSQDGELSLPGLPRGEYEARLITRSGLAPGFPIVLTRDQTVRLPVVSYLDLFAGILMAVFILAGLPLFGRRRKIYQALRRLSPAASTGRDG